MLTWKRERVRNFTEDFARGYIEMLVELDDGAYHQARFFERLAATGVVNDVTDEGDAEARDGARAKKWDSYNNKIREYGLGFVEYKAGGPGVWRASEMAVASNAARLTYRELVAIQMTRTQVPTPVMPLKEPYKSEIARGRWERPLRVTLEALENLRGRGLRSYLASAEFSQLQRVDAPDELDAVLDDVETVREGGAPSSDWADTINTVDIWFNELSYTGYVRRLNILGPGFPGLVIVPRWSRRSEAQALDDALPMRGYVDEVEVNAFHDVFCSLPPVDVIALLRAAPEVVVFDVPGDAAFDSSKRLLTGTFDVVGGLGEDDLLVVRGAGVSPDDAKTVFAVDVATEKSSALHVEVTTSASLRRMDNLPISI